MDTPKKKMPNIQKLERASDSGLEQRIRDSADKIAKKKARVEVIINTHQNALKSYIEYRLADEAACKKILEQRRSRISQIKKPA